MSDEDLQRVLGALAHDLNNLLTVLKGYPELLLLRPQLDPDVRRRLESMQRAGEKAGEYVRQMATVAGRTPSRAQALDLRAGLAAACEASGGKWLLDLPTRSEEAMADPEHLPWILGELLGVARERSGEGDVRVSLRSGVVQIQDAGPALDPRQALAPFGFKRSDRARGLALAAARTLARQWGGDLEVGGDPVVWRLTLPRAGTEGAPRPAGGASEPPPACAGPAS